MHGMMQRACVRDNLVPDTVLYRQLRQSLRLLVASALPVHLLRQILGHRRATSISHPLTLQSNQHLLAAVISTG